MELTPEDDDLLSYFLSADVAGDDLATTSLPRSDALNAAGTAPLYPSLGGSTGSNGLNGSSGVATEHFGLGQQQQAGTSSSSGGGMAALGPLSTLQQMQNAYHAAENAMLRSSSADEDAMSGAGLDSDEKRQRRCVCLYYAFQSLPVHRVVRSTLRGRDRRVCVCGVHPFRSWR